MWVQKADTPKPHHWRVWHTPIPHPRDVLDTQSHQWWDWGWYDDVTTAPVEKPKAKATKLCTKPCKTGRNQNSKGE